MKKSLFVITTLLFIAGSAAIAQRKAGSKIIGANIGSTSFSTGTSEYEYPAPSPAITYDSKSFSISANPNMGWFISDDIVVGANIGVGYSSYRNKSQETMSTYDSRSNNTDFGIGPWARFYFGDVKSSAWPYIQVNTLVGSGISHSKSTSRYNTGDPLTTYTYTSKSTPTGIFNWSAGASLGLTKMLNSHIGLDLAMSLTHYGSKQQSNTEYNYKYDVGPNTTSNSTYKNKSSSTPAGFNAGVVIFL